MRAKPFALATFVVLAPARVLDDLRAIEAK
jgi:hypothetical protein